VVVELHALLQQRDAEIARLHEDLRAAREELAATRTELTLLRQASAEANTRAAELSAQVGALGEAVAKGNERIAELLAIAQRKKSATSKTKKTKEPEAPPAVTDEVRTAFEQRPKPPDLPKKLLLEKRKLCIGTSGELG
jgi:predicted  nucleic acid-binding Zn-ribbon protein